MPAFRRLLPRRVLIVVAAIALLFALAMLHPFPRQSLFGPTFRGQPRWVWENRVRRGLQPEVYEKTFFARMSRCFGIEHKQDDLDVLIDDVEMLPIMLQMADDPDPALRQAAVTQFYFCKKLAVQPALPLMRSRLADESIPIRIEAAMAVATIDPDEDVLPVLLRVLDDPKSEHRPTALRALDYVAGVSDAAFDAMLKYAKDPEPGIRNEVMFALSRHRERGVPILLQGLNDTDAGVRNEARASLTTIDALRISQRIRKKE
jgi:HEAT repeat protein